MKVRNDFVTNSSSSSFIISKRNLTEAQIEAIHRHWELATKMGMVDTKWDTPWSIEENDQFITGYVFMDNFSMNDFLKRINVNENYVTWDEYEFDLSSYEESKEEFEDDEYDWEDLLRED